MRKILIAALVVISAGMLPLSTAADELFFEVHFSNVDGPFWGRGDGFAVDKLAQRYVPPGAEEVCSIEHQIATFFGPQDSLLFTIYSGGEAPEQGVAIASTTLAAAQVATTTTVYTSFPVNPCVILESGSTYWFVIERTVLSTGNGYISRFRPSNEYEYSSYWQYNGFNARGWQENTDREWSLRLRGSQLQRNEPVIIVPGILGTRLLRASDGEEVWPNIEAMKASADDRYLDELMLPAAAGAGIVAGEAIRNTTTTILGFPYESVYLDALISRLEQKGYVMQSDLFVAPYDWRRSMTDSAGSLDAVVKAAVKNSPTGKVNVIAHSLGGLLVKEYIRSAHSGELISKLILAGVPNLGAPKAAKILTYGDTMGFQFATRDVLNPKQVKKIAQQMPSIYELLPSEKYLEFIGPYVTDLRAGAPAVGLDFEATTAFLRGGGRSAELITRAADLHRSIDTLSLSASSTYVLTGCGQKNTIGGIRVYDDGEYKLDVAIGDGTVPLVSAGSVAAAVRYFIQTSHAGLVRDENSIAVIENILSGAPEMSAQGVSTDISSCEAGQKSLLFSLFSSALLHVYDSQDRHTGPLPDGNIELGIPGSQYEEMEDNSFVFAPEGDTYRVVAQATASGTAAISATSYVDAKPVAKASYVKVPLASKKTVAKVTVSDVSTATDLEVDDEGDGVPDTSVKPAVVQAAVKDITPPTIIVSSPESRTYLRSEVLPVTVTITDSESGVASSSIKLDGILQTGSTTLDLFFAKLGTHRLIVSAHDQAGNASRVERDFVVVADAASAAADLSRVTALGWFTGEGSSTLDFQGDLSAAKETLAGYCATKHITTDAYKILTDDINWLLNHE